MGDRANVVLQSKDNTADLVLYTHWGGYKVEATVQAGMRAAQTAGRLQGDDSYGMRSIVQTFFDSTGPADGLGAGIWVGEPNEPHVVVVDFTAQQVTFDPEGNEYGGERVTESFDAFLSRSFGSEADVAEANAREAFAKP